MKEVTDPELLKKLNSGAGTPASAASNASDDQGYLSGISETGKSLGDEYSEHPIKSAAMTLPAAAEAFLTQPLGNLAADIAATVHAQLIPGTSYAEVKKKYQQAADDLMAPQSDLGKKMSSATGAVLKPISTAVEKGGEGTASLAKKMGASQKTQDDLKESFKSLADILLMSRGGKKGIESVERFGKAPQPKPAVTKPSEDAVQYARSHGYVIKPSEGGGKVGSVVEGLSGSARLEREMALQNQKNSTRLAKEEIGIPEKDKIDETSLKKVEAPRIEVYKEVADKLKSFSTHPEFMKELNEIRNDRGMSLEVKRELRNLVKDYGVPHMSARDALKDISSLRADANRALSASKKQYNPTNEGVANVKLKIADAIESELERQASTIGDHALIDLFRHARQDLAKINAVRRATVGGEVLADKLLKERSGGRKLSGRLEVIANVAEHLPNAVRVTNKMKDRAPVGALEGVFGGAGLDAALHGDPASAAVGITGAVARPLARKVLRSKVYQNRLGKERDPGVVGFDPNKIQLGQ